MTNALEVGQHRRWKREGPLDRPPEAPPYIEQAFQVTEINTEGRAGIRYPEDTQVRSWWPSRFIEANSTIILTPPSQEDWGLVPKIPEDFDVFDRIQNRDRVEFFRDDTGAWYANVWYDGRKHGYSTGSTLYSIPQALQDTMESYWAKYEQAAVL